MIYTGNQKHLITWLSKRNAWQPSAQAMAIARLDENGRILGAVGIDQWNGHSCEMHMSGERGWLTRQVLRGCFKFVFGVLGCKKIVIMLLNPTEQLLDLEKRIGFTVQCRVPDAAPGGDLVIVTMDKKSCKWLEN